MKFAGYYLWSLLSTLYLFTVGVFSRNHRKLIYTIASVFGLHSKKRTRLPQTSISHLVNDQTVVLLTALHGQEGNITTQELAVLCCLVKQHHCTEVFEFGTFDGRTTMNLALNVPDNGKVFTLDLDPLHTGTVYQLAHYEQKFVNTAKATRFANHPAAAKITCLKGDTASFDFAPYQGRFDLVFIDASHARAYVESDTENAFRLLRQGKGLLVWHDNGVWDGVTGYLNQAYATDPRFAGLTAINHTSLAILPVARS